jgi:hypothetical protein
MIISPFTEEQARNICSDYQYLCGLPIDKKVPGKGVISCVTIAPYDQAKQWQFAQYYKDYRDPVKALKFYKGTQFSVLVLSVPLLRKRGVFFADLITILSQHGIFFDATRYAIARAHFNGSGPYRKAE